MESCGNVDREYCQRKTVHLRTKLCCLSRPNDTRKDELTLHDYETANVPPSSYANQNP